MDFDSVTFEDLFQFSPEPSQTTEGEDPQRSTNKRHQGEPVPGPAGTGASSALESEFHDLQVQLNLLQNSVGSSSLPQHHSYQDYAINQPDNMQGQSSSSATHTTTNTRMGSGQAPYISYPHQEDNMQKSNNWIDVPKVNRTSTSGNSSTLQVGSHGSTISSNSLEDQYASSLPG